MILIIIIIIIIMFIVLCSHEDMGDPDSALQIYLRLGDTEVFDLIAKKNLHNALLDNLEYLLKLGEKVLHFNNHLSN